MICSFNNKLAWERKFLGANSTWNESYPARSLPGAKVPTLVSLSGANAIHLELLLRGAKVHRNKKSWYPFSTESKIITVTGGQVWWKVTHKRLSYTTHSVMSVKFLMFICRPISGYKLCKRHSYIRPHPVLFDSLKENTLVTNFAILYRGTVKT